MIFLTLSQTAKSFPISSVDNAGKTFLSPLGTDAYQQALALHNDLGHRHSVTEALAVLAQARNRLLDQAGQIHDAALRQSFLENVPVHRTLSQDRRTQIDDSYHLHISVYGGRVISTLAYQCTICKYYGVRAAKEKRDAGCS